MIRTTRDLSLIACVLLAACTTDRTRRDYLERLAADLEPPERVAIVIPGFAVTRLYDPHTKRYVWGTPRTAIRTLYPDDLDLPTSAESPPDRLVPRGFAGSRGPVNVAWQLVEALRKYGGYFPGRTVHSFEYDWRLSARENAVELARLIDRVSPDRKVDLISHSAGALVALTYVKLGEGADRVDRLVLVAPPARGVVDAFRLFIRPERFLRRTISPETVATWPSIYELLPEDGEFIIEEDGSPAGFNVWEPATWSAVTSEAVPHVTHLANARRLRNELAAAPLPPAVRQTVIAGDCVATTVKILLRKDGSIALNPEELRDGESDLRSSLFAPGDGTVPVKSALAAGEPILLCDGHQGLATDPSVHRTVLRALGREW